MTMLALIPAAFMFAIGTVMGKTMTKTWEKRQQAFSDPVSYTHLMCIRDSCQLQHPARWMQLCQASP